MTMLARPGNDDGRLGIQFVLGKANDGAAISLARSHAMKVVRERQRRRQLKERDLAKRKEAMYSESRSTIETFANATLDPFSMISCLPLNMQANGKIDSLLAHSLTFCAPGTTKQVVLPVAAQNPALMISMLYMAYAHKSSLEAKSDPRVALQLRSAAITEINRKMLLPSTATCTNLIASISFLAMATWCLGNSEETECHLDGMRAMVSHRGMGSLGVFVFGQIMRKVFILQHSVMSSFRGNLSTAAFELAPQQSTYEVKVHSPFCPPSRLALLGTEAPGLYKLLDELDYIVYYIECISEGALQPVSAGLIHTEFDSRNVDLDGASSTSERSSWLYRCCKLAFKILLEAITSQIPLVATNVSLTLAMVEVLAQSKPSEVPLRLKGLLFSNLLVGSAASWDKSGHALLHCMLNQTLFDVAICEELFEPSMKTARRFANVQVKLSSLVKLADDVRGEL